MKRAATIIIIFIFFVIPASSAGTDQKPETNAAKPESGWQKLADGLELGFFDSPQRAEIGDSKIRILRIDPTHYELKLLNASVTKKGRSLSARQWCRQNGLVAAINASMFQADYKTSVSFMRTRTHVNNPRISKDMTILAFDRLGTGIPEVKIIDRQCEDFRIWKHKYGTLVQSIRMISCKGKNVWRQQPKKYSTVAIGIDKADRVLFIHVGSPFSTHDVINILQSLPLEIDRAMYTEGGPQAQLYIKSGDHEYEFIGHSEIDLGGKTNSLFSWPIPNTIGVSPRKDWEMAQKWLFTIIAVILVTMTACSGSLKGIMRKDTSRVSFNYSNSQIRNAELQVVLPEGERFKGCAEKGINLTSPIVGASTSMDRFEAVETFQGNAEAVLSGDRGNIMHCRFLLTDTILGFKAGGFGICQLSDGRVIDIFF